MILNSILFGLYKRMTFSVVTLQKAFVM